MEDVVLDLPDVMERVQDDQELLLELLDIFEKDFIEKRESITRFLKDNQSGAVRDLSHSMKGAAGNISAKAIFNTCAKMEQLAEKGNLAEVKNLLDSLDKQFLELQKYIVDYKKKF